MRLTPVLTAATALLVAACGGDGAEQSLTGIITHVEPLSITAVESFTLRTDGGETIVFRIAPDAAADPEEGFVASHLRSHSALAEKVTVFYREEGGELLALRLEHGD